MKQSAGLLLYRYTDGQPEVLLVHPGGPFWQHKDAGAWSIPKGEFDGDEQPLEAAIRECREETGVTPTGEFMTLQSVKLKSGKIVHAWALHMDIDAQNIKSNTIEIEWPYKSGKRLTIPEVDRAEWFSVSAALTKINPAQAAFILRLADKFAM
ncbi:NUDIX hydrolase [Flavobacterium magnum]|uniref:NUDIX hydrolase n=1 Tax=Flavobacterium magnum TaxID=2162713 RepID=A0A2S0RJY7_9FLAO|nr:NUDIX domain-containing protein [Flavobacterium magnum]AWA31461.1 NUDIX hydrolase [Flavobacterium magnum]